MAALHNSRDTTLLLVAAVLLILGTALLLYANRTDTRQLSAVTWLSISQTFSWAKLIYTTILVGLVALLVSEIGRIWFEQRTTVGTLTLLENHETQETKGRALAFSLVARHSDLRRRFSRQVPSDFESEQRLLPEVGSPIEHGETILSDLQITVQDIPVTDILTHLRRWVSAPRALQGTVEMTGDEYRAQVRLVDSEIKLADGTMQHGVLHLEGTGGLEQAAFDLACSLIWIEAARVPKGLDIAIVGREAFCHWTQRWVEQQTLARRLRQAGSFSADETKRLRAALTAVSYAIQNGATYPKYWSLRADLTRLLPEEERNKPEIRERIQNDDLTYFTLVRLDAKRDVSAAQTELEAYRILAEARPAIKVKDGLVEVDKDSLWKRVFEREGSRAAVQRASKATGLFRISENDSSAHLSASTQMAIAIGKNLIATPAYSILPRGLRPKGELSEIVNVPEEFSAEFVFADAWPADDDRSRPRHPIKRIFYLGGNDSRPELALLEIEGHDTSLFPPLLVQSDRAKTLKPGDFTFLIGFPTTDPRLPPEFMELLLGDGDDGSKRIMPGRVISAPGPGASSDTSILSGGAIVVDASTSGGTGGAPLIDLKTGRLVGLNFAGRWQNITEGKFAYVRPVSWLFPSETVRSYLEANAHSLELDELANRIGGVLTRAEAQVAALQDLDNSTETSSSLEVLGVDGYANRVGYDVSFLGTNVPLPSILSDPDRASDVLAYQHFAVQMNVPRQLAYYAAENVDGSTLLRLKRSGRWIFDPRIPENQQTSNDLYRKNRLDRGHLARRSNVEWGDTEAAQRAGSDVNHFTNATPQLQEFNQKTWNQLEDGILTYLRNTDLKASIFSGPVFREDDPVYRGVKIPLSYWKIVVTEIDGEMQAISYILSQSIEVEEDSLSGHAEAFDLFNSQVAISEIEALTGLDFGPVRDFASLDFGAVSK